MTIVLLLLIALLACSEQPDDIIPAVPALPVIDIEDHPDSGTHYRYKLLPREPLPYPVTVRVDALTRGFHARSYDFWGGEFALPYTDYVTISPDSNIYVGAFPRVSEWQVKDNHFWVPVVTSVEMEIAVITDAEIAKLSLDIEREKERAYTIGKSTLTLGAHLPPVPVDL